MADDDKTLADAERMTKLSAKWAKEAIAGIFPTIEAPWEDLSEYFRQCLEEWTGEGRQEPKPETLAEIDAMLNPHVFNKPGVTTKPLDAVGLDPKYGEQVVGKTDDRVFRQIPDDRPFDDATQCRMGQGRDEESK